MVIKRSRRAASALRAFLKTEASGGLLLMASALVALVWANSPWRESYQAALHLPVGPISLLHVINDGLMAVFFLLVGLEIKRELVDGELSSWPRRALPGLAALGGMIVPALVYLAFNGTDPQAAAGWAIPAATDIAFALGVLALLGKRVPGSLKIFLAALAILDDLGAILIIALFYTASLKALWLAASGLILLALIGLNLRRVQTLWPFLLLGAGLWFTVWQSGLHATLAGVALALTIPVNRTIAAPDDARSPLHRLEHALSPMVAYAIIPVFGLANAGVYLGDAGQVFDSPITLGVLFGLLLGKPVGILLFSTVAIRAGWADLPSNAGWRQMIGIATLCGIGFTMSLFIEALAFGSPELQAEAKIGILTGSLLASLTGLAILGQGSRPKPAVSRVSQTRPG